MNCAISSKSRFPIRSPLLFAIQERTPPLGEKGWVVRLRSTVLKGTELVVIPQVVRRENGISYLAAEIPDAPSGFYKAAVLTPRAVPFEMPLLILDPEKLREGAAYTHSEFFCKLDHSRTLITQSLRNIFRDRLDEIEKYDPIIDSSNIGLDRIAFDSLLLGGSPASEIYFLAETIAAELAYLGPLGIREARFYSSRKLNRIEMGLWLRLAASFGPAFEYVEGPFGELAIIRKTGALDRFESEVQIIGPQELTLRASFLIRERWAGEIEFDSGVSPRDSQVFEM